MILMLIGDEVGSKHQRWLRTPLTFSVSGESPHLCQKGLVRFKSLRTDDRSQRSHGEAKDIYLNWQCIPVPMERLPPKQRQIDRIPIWGKDHPGIVADIPRIKLEEWALTVEGEVKKPTTLKWTDLLDLGVEESVSDFHCVEGWSVLGCKWEGIPFTKLCQHVEPKPSARFVEFDCYDGYTTSLPLETLREDAVLLACKLDDKWLEPGLGGPLRLIVPNKYAYKSAMWIKTADFLHEDRLGYWESRGYSNTADPWKNDRWA